MVKLSYDTKLTEAITMDYLIIPLIPYLAKEDNT